MKIHCAFLVLLTALMAAGCAQEGHGLTVDPTVTLTVDPTVTMVGFAKDSLIASTSTRKPVTLGASVETDGAMAFKVTTGTVGKCWDKVLLGVSPIGAKASGSVGGGSGTPLIFYLNLGWVYIYGDEPVVESDRVSAGADGSAILVQIDPDAKVHRVYLLAGTKATVKNQRAPFDVKFLSLNEYVEAPASGSLGPVQSIPALGPIKAFRDGVLEEVDRFFP